jgi:hypothetical protein
MRSSTLAAALGKGEKFLEVGAEPENTFYSKRTHSIVTEHILQGEKFLEVGAEPCFPSLGVVLLHLLVREHIL